MKQKTSPAFAACSKNGLAPKQKKEYVAGDLEAKSYPYYSKIDLGRRNRRRLS
jgi:hypothetical protein